MSAFGYSLYRDTYIFQKLILVAYNFFLRKSETQKKVERKRQKKAVLFCISTVA